METPMMVFLMISLRLSPVEGSDLHNADSNIGTTCHGVQSPGVKYQNCSGGDGDLNEHHNQNLSVSNTHSPTEVREDKNTRDNLSRDVSPGVIPNRVVEARPTNKDLESPRLHLPKTLTKFPTSIFQM